MRRGKLRIFLGPVAGVGKTYAMLNEGRLRRQRGVDVVIGLVEPHGRDETTAQIRDLEVVPRQAIERDGATSLEMDVDAILERAPEVCLVDDLAHTNTEGCRNPRRWQDVAEVLDAGIDVLSTLNIHHLESLNDVVEQITGVKQRETVPDGFVRAADEVQLVELTPEALRRRLAHGDIYPPERIDAAQAKMFRPGILGALRELALMWLADRVDEDLQDYMTAHAVSQPWETRERILVAVTGAPGADRTIRRAARIASRLKGDLIGVHVRAPNALPAVAPAYLEDDRGLLRELGGDYRETAGDDVAAALLAVARTERATQLVLGASRRSRWEELLRGSIIHDVVCNSDGIDVHVISHEDVRFRPTLARARRLSGVSPRRRIVGYLVGVVGLATLTGVLNVFQDRLELSSILLFYLATIVAAAAIGGGGPAVVTTLGAFALADFFFTEPFHTFVIDKLPVLVALVVFAAVATVVSWLVNQAARRSAEADRATAEARTLSGLTTTLLDSDDPLPQLVIDLVATFDLRSAALLRRRDEGWQVEASAGHPIPRSPEDGDDTIQVPGGYSLVLDGAGPPVDDRRVLTAFAAQLAVGLAARRLQERAAQATEEARINELRASLLSAVSHDLRTPLSSIKASASSLLSDDVTWEAQTVTEFAQAIVEEADRLNALVGNLLDMSRLQAGAVQLDLQPTPVEESVPNALKGLAARDVNRVRIWELHELPPVDGDPVLIERIVANLVDNALRWSPDDETVGVRGSESAGQVELRVVDRGPGIPERDRQRIFQPFQRHGDSSHAHGVGLGLAVARGFAQAMNGQLWVEDTPGGGTTMVLQLRGASRA